MKKCYWTALLALPLLAAPAFADGGYLDSGISLRFRCSVWGPRGCGPQLGPWYNYWPLEAHFITPAPSGYPFWPQPQALLPAPVPPPLPKPTVPPPPTEAKPSGPEVKPIGYFYYPYPSYSQNILYGPAPSYWAPRP